MSAPRIISSSVMLCLAAAACAGAAILIYPHLFRSPDGPAPPPVTTEYAKAAKETPHEKDLNLMLAESEREYLWQLEHHGNILSRQAFPQLTGALVKGDAAALAAVLGDSFQGGLLNDPVKIEAHTEILDVVREAASDKPAQPADRALFVQKLLELRSIFKKSVKAKLSLMRLRPQNRDDLDGLWEGAGQLRLWGEIADGQPAEITVYLTYRVVRPTKENVAKSGWLAAATITQSQVARSRQFLLREVAAERGMEPKRLHDNWVLDRVEPVTGGVYLCDFDRDGIMDVLITDRNGYFLYKGLPDGKFRNVTTEVGLPAIAPDSSPASLAAAWVDIDGDGWEDLILGRFIFRNEQGKRFTNVTAKSNLRFPKDMTGVAVADYNGDGKLDLYVFHTGKAKEDSWLRGKSGDGRGNQLFRNEGNWQFKDVTAEAHAGGGERSTFTALWLDANNDGRPDLFVPNEFGDGVLLINQGDGTFKETALSGQPDDFGTMGATCGDINNDGHIDIYCANMYSKAGARVIGNMRPDTYSPEVMAKLRTFVKGSQLHINRGAGKFESKGNEWQVNDAGWAYGAALVDLDNDGWLDIHATAGFISRNRNDPDG
jgi:hypothetical protein